WEFARSDIYSEWLYATDPANLQPKVRPALKAAADQLRSFPPPDLLLEDLNRCIESVEAPWGIRIEKQIKDAMNAATGVEASKAVVEAIKRLGLEPFKPPDPLPPIEMQDVRLVCWLQII